MHEYSPFYSQQDVTTTCCKENKGEKKLLTPSENTRVPLCADLYHVQKQYTPSEVEKIVFEPSFNGGKPIEVSKSNANLAILELNVILKILRMEWENKVFRTC